jgi:L-lysine exporter family protein LysE/ArgO
MQTLFPTLAQAPAFNAGLALSLSLIMALGPQNAHLMRMGLLGQHVVLTVAVCIVSDVLLIGLGVLGLAQVGGLSELVKTVLIGAGIVFLLVYGAQAFGHFRAGGVVTTAQPAGAQKAVMTRTQATGAALALAWLNPHAWLDTAVLIGTASLAWGAPGNTVFGIGAATGSAIWFAGLGLGVFCLGQRLCTPAIWRLMDGVVAAMMWGTALLLGRGLLGL